MTSHEILKASLLDILFDNRNKQYGAYTLRKYYEHRMGIALAATLSLILFLVFLIKPNSSITSTSNERRTTVQIAQVEPPLPVIPPVERIHPPSRPATERVAEVQHVSNYRMVEHTTHQLPDLRNFTGVVGENNTLGNTTGNVSIEPPNQPLSNGNGSGTETTVKEPEAVGPTKAPAFPGGVEAWMRFLNKHLNTPEELEPGDKRTVHIRFTVSIDGSITAFEVVRSGGSAFDNEVVRVLKKMPKWEPALQSGKPITVQFTQPVTFVSEEE